MFKIFLVSKLREEKIVSEITSWTQDVNLPHIRRSKDIQDVFWRSYDVHSIYVECAKFCGSCAIVVLLGVVPSYYHAFVGISWVQNIFSWVFCAFRIFSLGYFVGPKFFLVGISWVQSFFSWVFCGSKIFSRGNFVGLKFPLVDSFVIFGCWPHNKNWNTNRSQTTYSIPNEFQQL